MNATEYPQILNFVYALQYQHQSVLFQMHTSIYPQFLANNPQCKK